MIEERVLFVSYIPVFVDEFGVRYTDDLWKKDLVGILAHVRRMTLASPLRKLPAEATGLLPMTDPEFGNVVAWVDLPECYATLDTLVGLPRAAAHLWKAIGQSDLVQINLGAWPIDLAWMVGPMVRLRRRFLMIGVAGAAWRMGWRRPIRLRRLFRAVAFETLGRVCVNLSHLAFFTHAGYMREMLLPWRRARGHVVPASWIDQEVILPRERAEAAWEEKLRDADRPLRAAFVGKLVAAKGVGVLIDALDRLEQRGVRARIDIFGVGPLDGECAAAAARPRKSVAVKLRGTLPYGSAFFDALRAQDVLLVPSVSDEQPRIAYDAFSQAVPVIASDTEGLLQTVTDGQDGKIIRSNDPEALANAIAWAADHRPVLRDLGIHSLERAHSLTHGEMHAQRAAIIEQALAAHGA